jgi:hypothetical protein
MVSYDPLYDLMYRKAREVPDVLVFHAGNSEKETR